MDTKVIGGRSAEAFPTGSGGDFGLVLNPLLWVAVTAWPGTSRKPPSGTEIERPDAVAATPTGAPSTNNCTSAPSIAPKTTTNLERLSSGPAIFGGSSICVFSDKVLS